MILIQNTHSAIINEIIHSQDRFYLSAFDPDHSLTMVRHCDLYFDCSLKIYISVKYNYNEIDYSKIDTPSIFMKSYDFADIVDYHFNFRNPNQFRTTYYLVVKKNVTNKQ
jgi:hypothetical protein